MVLKPFGSEYFKGARLCLRWFPNCVRAKRSGWNCYGLVDKVALEHINFPNSQVVVRTGDTAEAEDLEKVSVKDARTVLVVSPADHTREAAVARTLHVLSTMRSMKWTRDGTCVVEDQLPPQSSSVPRDMLRDFKGVGTG